MDPFHACSILKQLKTMCDEGQLTDIVVEVDHGKTFSCHRNVLAAISPYFRYDDGRNLYYYPYQIIPFRPQCCPLGYDIELGQINEAKQ
uniref:BTB domain-containing protein n=1 Tax=Peromyscus maniculatus bairdii TaxID=230844 RepID=A0A8C8UJ68_PERMB